MKAESNGEKSKLLPSGKKRTKPLKESKSRNPNGAPVKNWIEPIPVSPEELARFVMTTPPDRTKVR